MAERNEINAIISEEMKKMSNALLQLGQAYYEKHAFDFEPEFEGIVASIKNSEERVANICLQTQAEETEIVPEYDDTVPEETVVETIEETPAAPVAPAIEPVAEISAVEPAVETPAAPVAPVAEIPAVPVEPPVTEFAQERCIKCGAVFEENAAFCNNCGAPKSAPAPVSEGLIMCPSCKEMIRPGTNFCTACGSVMPSAMPVSVPEISQHPVAEVVAPAEAPASSVEETIYTPAEEAVVPESAAPAIGACPSCGAPIIEYGPFCTACGSRLN